jgi:hypothetical protein
MMPLSPHTGHDHEIVSPLTSRTVLIFPGQRFRPGRRRQFTISSESCSSGIVVAKKITLPTNSASRIAGPGTPVVVAVLFFLRMRRQMRP